MDLCIRIKWKNIIRFLWITVFVLTTFSLIGQYSTYYWGDGHLYQFVPQFYLDREMNVPTWFSSFLFLMTAFLLWTIAGRVRNTGKTYSLYWKGLAVVFIILSLDEIASIHESWVGTFRQLFNASGYLYFSWIIPAAALVLLLVLIYTRFFFALPIKIRILVLISGVLFLSGALGMEMIAGPIVEARGSTNFSYALIANTEEFLELSGLVTFITALFVFLDREV